ncbi:MAG: efflux RND transporter periplasmic adaptor subunit, partial [bacterium]
LQVEVIQTRYDTLTDQLTVSGSLLADVGVALSTETAGRVVGIYFDEDSYVQQGQLLVKLNDHDLLAQQAKAEQQLKLAKTTQQRIADLLKKQAVRQEEYDQAVTEVAVRESELLLLQAQLDKLHIRAPFSGRIGLRRISPGAYVSPGTNMANLQRTHPMKLEFELPEKYGPRIHTGRSVRFATPGQPGQHTARIYALEPGIDPETRSIRARAQVPNPQGLLKPGAFADVLLPLETLENAIMVPTEAVVPGSTGDLVWLVQGDSLQPQPVVTGVRTGARVQIVKGLKPGMQVLVSGILQARPGARVQAKVVKR